ncbi:tetratricopeptide repeat protein [Reinekea forsetii]|nr:tetratricopeptide repeat protein [Reinekea forsetii]
MYDTDQEQIEAIKAWWSANANWVIASVLVFIFAFAGWNWYQVDQLNHKEEASRLYDRLLVNVSATEADLDERASMISALKTDYADLGYAVMAALFEAKDSVEAKEYSAALSSLEFAYDHADESLHGVILYRKALVQFGMGELDAALATLDAITGEGHQALTFELKGDIYLAQGNESAARDAYQSAVDLSSDQGINNPYLAVKLNDLAVAE